MQIDKTRNTNKPQMALIDFEHGGKLRSFKIYANSLEDARARLEAIKETGRVEGFPVWTIPVPLPTDTPKHVLHTIGDILVRIVSFFKG